MADDLCRLLVFGSRSWDDYETLEGALSEIISYEAPGQRWVIVHGACPTGADAMAERFAQETGGLSEPHPAKWAQHGKSAGFIRNSEMVALRARLAVGFFDGWTPGSADTLRKCVEWGIPVRVVPKRGKRV
jgi:hypothetical protein